MAPMTDHQRHAGDALADHHAEDSHEAMPHSGADDHAGADDHGGGHGDHHGGEALGPVDVQMWAAAAVGVLLGLVVMVAFIQAAA
jgi:hypothetical protein